MVREGQHHSVGGALDELHLWVDLLVGIQLELRSVHLQVWFSGVRDGLVEGEWIAGGLHAICGRSECPGW